jgi:hypothetical protein
MYTRKLKGSRVTDPAASLSMWDSDLASEYFSVKEHRFSAPLTQP